MLLGKRGACYARTDTSADASAAAATSTIFTVELATSHTVCASGGGSVRSHVMEQSVWRGFCQISYNGNKARDYCCLTHGIEVRQQ